MLLLKLAVLKLTSGLYRVKYYRFGRKYWLKIQILPPVSPDLKIQILPPVPPDLKVPILAPVPLTLKI
jgi:hypothetical protein